MRNIKLGNLLAAASFNKANNFSIGFCDLEKERFFDSDEAASDGHGGYVAINSWEALMPVIFIDQEPFIFDLKSNTGEFLVDILNKMYDYGEGNGEFKTKQKIKNEINAL